MLMVCVLLAAAEAPEAPKAAPPAEIVSRLPTIRALAGEEVLYDGFVSKGGIYVHVGTATFTVTEEKDPRVTIKAVAEGGKFGYSIRAEVSSELDAASGLPRTHVFSQTGSERRFKRTHFENGKIICYKTKHCKDPNCTNPAHMVEEGGWFSAPKKVHCPGCKDIKHYYWKVMKEHQVKETFLDMLTALYVARSANFTTGAAFVVPVVQDSNLWNVTVTVGRQEKITLDSGQKYDCVKVVLDPKSAASEEQKPRFEGLFGINGSINVWMDTKTHLPVKIHGIIPFAFMDLNAEVYLKKIVKEAGGKPPASLKSDAAAAGAPVANPIATQ